MTVPSSPPRVRGSGTARHLPTPTQRDAAAENEPWSCGYWKNVRGSGGFQPRSVRFSSSRYGSTTLPGFIRLPGSNTALNSPNARIRSGPNIFGSSSPRDWPSPYPACSARVHEGASCRGRADRLLERIAGRFGRAEPQARARAFVLGLPRVNCWSIAGTPGDAMPGAIQVRGSRFPGDGGLFEADAVGADAELAHGWVVVAGPGLDDGQGPAHGAVVAVVVERDRVVGQVGDREL
jgi:hypothetical protein